MANKANVKKYFEISLKLYNIYNITRLPGDNIKLGAYGKLL